MKKLIKCKNGIIKEMTLDEVVKEFRKILYHKSITRWCTYFELDDLNQMGYMGIMKSYKYYDISVNTPFVTYTLKVIQDIIKDTYKRENKLKHKLNAEFSSIYSNVLVEAEDFPMIETIGTKDIACEDMAISNITTKKIEDVFKTFSNKDQELIELHFIKGLNCVEIGRIYNKTRACISYRLIQLKKKLQLKLQDEVLICI